MRGQEIEIGPGDPRWDEATRWILQDDFAQMERYGKIMFRKGPWPGRRSYTDGAGSFETVFLGRGDAPSRTAGRARRSCATPTSWKHAAAAGCPPPPTSRRQAWLPSSSRRDWLRYCAINPLVLTLGAVTTTGNNMLCLTVRLTGGKTLTGVADSKSNTWNVDQPSSTAASGCAVASCVLTTPLVCGTRLR